MCPCPSITCAPSDGGLKMWIQEPKHLIPQNQVTQSKLLNSNQEMSLLKKTIFEFNCRSVRFATNVETHEIPSVKDFSEQLKLDVWYDSESLKNIIHDSWSDCNAYVRGMEDKAPDSIALRRQRVEEVLDAVLEEQINQWEKGEYNPERLAQMSRTKSAFSRQAARMIGFSDELVNQR